MALMPALISFNPNTVILSADTNSNNTTIRNTYNAHDVATTSVHGMGLSTIVGTDLTQTLTNKTLTAPILGGTITGTYTLAGTPTITAPAISNPTVTGTFKLINAGDLILYSDAGITSKFSVSAFNGDTTLASNAKLTFAGASTYILSSSANPQFWVGGVDLIDMSATRVALGKPLVMTDGDYISLNGALSNAYSISKTAATSEIIIRCNSLSAVTINGTEEVLIPRKQAPTANYMNGNSTLQMRCNFAVTGASSATTAQTYNVTTASISVSSYAITIPLTTAFADSNYTITGNLAGGSGSRGYLIFSKSASSVTVYAVDPSGALFTTGWFGTVMATGNQ